MLRVRNTSSLEKVFIDSHIEDYAEQNSEKIFANQIFAYQVVMNNDYGDNMLLEVEVESEIKDYISVREVQSVPSEMPVRPGSDERARTSIGLYPDVLRPLNYFGRVFLVHGQTRSLWVEVAPEAKIEGTFEIKIRLRGSDFVIAKDADFGFKKNGEILCETTFNIEISRVKLPEQTLMFTQWFYTDCLANYYNVEIFSDKHFEICERFIRAAIRAGRTMILTPLLTPALDTLVGWERPTTQLVKIKKHGDDYEFDFSLMERWLDMCNRCGVKQYEISHFFSQWGAYHAPKVVATVNGEEKRIFGWDTDALSTEYVSFLRQLIKSFIDFMKARGEDKKCWFHISDEPHTECLEQYKKNKEAIGDLLKDYHIMDALSNYEFYSTGSVDTPVPSTRSIAPFLENNVPNLWCYYCGGICNGQSNCHMAMTQSRTRFIGVQMFKYNIVGFLNWGYNFYYDRGSCDVIDPFGTTDGYGFERSGDGFMVYPGQKGMPWESIRMRAFYEGLEDMRLFQLAEKLYSHEQVVEEIEKICGTVVFDKCVNDAKTMLAIRHRINELVFAKTEK